MLCKVKNVYSNLPKNAFVKLEALENLITEGFGDQDMIEITCSSLTKSFILDERIKNLKSLGLYPLRIISSARTGNVYTVYIVLTNDIRKIDLRIYSCNKNKRKKFNSQIDQKAIIVRILKKLHDSDIAAKISLLQSNVDLIKDGQLIIDLYFKPSNFLIEKIIHHIDPLPTILELSKSNARISSSSLQDILDYYIKNNKGDYLIYQAESTLSRYTGKYGNLENIQLRLHSLGYEIVQFYEGSKIKGGYIILYFVLKPLAI